MVLQVKRCFIAIIALFMMYYLCKTSIALADEQNQGFEEVIVALKINYVETDLISTTLKTHNNDILVPLADLSGFEIKASYIERGKATINNIDYINLSKLVAIDYKLDEENLVLIINFPPSAMQLQNLSAWHESSHPLEGYRGAPIRSFFINYDLTTTRQHKKYYAAGVQELNYSNTQYSVNQTVLTRQDFFDKKPMTIIRLDSNWTRDNEDSIASLRIGDSITNGSEWSSSTRFAGAQYSTDFSLRPNLITYPLVDFKGRADLPSALDVYANSQLLYKTELKTGEFNMNNLPVSAGQGALEVKQQDITGKLQTITIPYYISPVLLKKDLTDYSFDVGTQRIGYGTLSNKYRYLVTSFDYNKGISANWTAGAHFESMKNVFAVGATNLYQIGNYGVVSASLATSGPRLSKAQKMMLGYSFQGQIFSWSIQQMISGHNFINTFNLDSSGIRKSTQGSVSYSLNDKSSVGLSYLRALAESNDQMNKTELLSINYQNNLTKNSSLRISVGTDLKNKGNNFVALSFGINLGANYLSSNVYNDGKKWVEQVGISSNSKEYNGLTYRGNLTKDSPMGYDAQIEKSLPKIDATFYAFNYANDPVQQLSLQGAVAATADGVFATKTISDSFAIARVAKFKGIGVYHNNQYITKTNEKGIVFIPNVPSYIDSKIRIDEQDLPLSAQFSDTTFIVNAKRKTGVVANFDITKAHIAELTLVDINGTYVTQDSDVKIDGLEEEFFVGYDGKVYVANLKNLKEINGSACKVDECCHFSISLEGMDDIEIIDLGVQKCQ